MGLGEHTYQIFHWVSLLALTLPGMGVKISTIPVFSAEVSPATIRGGIVTSFQLWVSFGMFVYV